jgi:hypothetical protein
MKYYFIVFIFLVSGFVGFSQCIITNQPLSSQVVCQNGATTPLEVINEPPSQCSSVCAGQGVTTFQWFVNTTSDTLGSQIISGADSNVYIPPSNIIGQNYFFCRIYVDGCLWNYSDIVSVLIVGFPNPNLSDGIMCSGQQPPGSLYDDQIIFDPMADTSGTFSYSWMVPASMGDPGNVNQIFCDFEGLYVVSVIDINGCVGVDSAFVTVLPTAISDVWLTINSGNSLNSNPCEGDTLNLSVVITYNGFDFISVPNGSYVSWTTPANQPNPGNTNSFSTMIPGYYIAEVLDINGCWSTFLPGDFSYNPNPTVSAGSDINVCLGDSVILSASGGQTYDWDTGENSSSIQVSPDTTTTYVVQATNIYGCTGTDQVTVNIIPIPTVTVSAITMCAGAIGTLTAVPSTPGGTFVWTQFPNNLPLPGNSSSISISPTTNSIYNVQYFDVNNCPSNTAMANVTVNPTSVVNISGTTTICSGNTATLTANSSLTGAGGFYSWSPNTSSGQTVTINPMVSTSYSVYYTLNGCPSNTTNHLVTVYQTPTVSVNNVGICTGGQAILTAVPDIAGGTYSWNTFPTAATTQSITVQTATTSTFTVVYTSPNNCPSQFATATVTVLPVSALTVTTFPSDPGLCNGTGLVTLDPTGNFSVYWGNGVEGENGYDLCPGLTVVYVVDNDFGCQYSAYEFVEETGNSYPLSIQLNVQDVSFDGNCDGSAQFFGFGGIPPYFFELVDASNSIVTNQEWADTLCSGYYNVRIMDAMGGIDSLPFYVADPSNVLTFNPYPDSIIIDTLHTEIYEDCNIDFVTLDSAWVTQINYINADTAIITWAIQDMNGIQYIDQSYNVTNLQGSFTVELTIFCPGKALGDPYLKVYTTIYISNDFNVSINELSETDVISLYPNPTSDYVQIKSQNKIDRIQLFDSFGREIALSNKISENEYKIRLPKENGMYILKIICENGKSYSKRIVKTSKY